MIKRSQRIWIGILAGVLVGNGIGAVIYLTAESASNPPKAEPAPVTIDEASVAHRVAGLDAIERGDWEAAIKEFSAGLRTPNPAPDLARLMSIAHSLRTRAPVEQESVQEEADEPPTAPPPIPVQRPVLPKQPLLLVLSRPDGLSVEVDGAPYGPSPVRIEVSPGPHTVTLRHEDQTVVDVEVVAEAGKVALVDEDLTDQIRPAAAEDTGVAETAAPSNGADSAGASAPSSDPVNASNTATVPTPTPVTPAAAPPQAQPKPSPPPPAITRKAIRRVVGKAQSKFQKCYEQQLQKLGLDFSGRVVLRLRIAGDGRVQKASIANSDLLTGRMERCIQYTARRLRFPAPRGGPTEISVGLQFELRS